MSDELKPAHTDGPLVLMLSALRDDIDEMAKRKGPSRFPSVEQLGGWKRMVNSAIAAWNRRTGAGHE